MTSSTHTLSMSRTATNRSHAASSGSAGLLKQWWDAFWLRRAQRATAMMLRALDDYSLRDIGISRSEIDSVVYGKPGDRRVQAHFERGGCCA